MAYNPEYQKEWYKNNREAHIAKARLRAEKRKQEIRAQLRALKSITPCTDCKIQYPFYVMQFDHVRGEKLADLAQAAGKQWSDKKLQDEIDKCEIVCANCHAIRTYERSQNGC